MVEALGAPEVISSGTWGARMASVRIARFNFASNLGSCPGVANLEFFDRCPVATEIKPG
jgi:hypothetical protein